MINEKGVFLIEILIVISIVGFLVILIASLPNSINLIGKSKHLSIAREIAVKEIEDKRAVPYINLVKGEVTIQDPRINLLPSGKGISLIEDCAIPVCTNQENAKLVTVSLSWQESGKDQQIVLKTLIAEGGL